MGAEFYSPLRYPGGKGKLADFMKLVFRENLLCDGCYIEPYAGGASVALSLLLTEHASRVVINDIDRSIFAFWYSVLNSTDEFCRMIERTKLNVNTWKKQRLVQKAKKTCSLLDLGFSTFYLNRTNRSGIIKGGLIGGLDQTGKWKIDARFNKAELIERIQRIATYKNRIALFNLDACVLLEKIAPRIKEKALYYLDPPYYVKGRALYVSHYKTDDHKDVADVVTGLKRQRWIVSYDYNPAIMSFYKGFSHMRYSINYSAAKASLGEEVMFFSRDLAVPDVDSPIKILSRNIYA